jgi:hypothetical protein
LVVANFPCGLALDVDEVAPAGLFDTAELLFSGDVAAALDMPSNCDTSLISMCISLTYTKRFTVIYGIYKRIA